MPKVLDAKIRGDRYSPVLRERKKVLQLPKDLKDKVAATSDDSITTTSKATSK